MDQWVKLSKTDVAKRQLETAIELFFSDGDFVSIHTLARAAHEVLDTLARKNGIRSKLSELMDLVKEDRREEVRKFINNPKNFFKHANNDSEGTLDFNPDSNSFFLWDACRIYQILFPPRDGNKLIYLFEIWFTLNNTQIFTAQKEFLDRMADSFTISDKAKFFSEASAAYDLNHF